MTTRVFQRIQGQVEFRHLYEVDGYIIALRPVRSPLYGIAYTIFTEASGDTLYSGVFSTVERTDTFAVLNYLCREYLDIGPGSLVEVFAEDCMPRRKHRRRFLDVGESVYFDKGRDTRGDEYGF